MNVLKKTIYLFLFLSFSNAASAQFSLGLRGGINIADISFDQDEDYYYYGEDGLDFLALMGSTVGLVGEIKLHKNFAIQPELMFVQKGAEIDFPDYYYYYNSGESEFRINYLEMPILAKVIFGNETLEAFVATGPSFGYAASGYIKLGGEKDEIDGDEWDDYNRFDISANFALGTALQVNTGKAFVDLRYLLGFSNFADDSDVKFRHRGINISVGYLHNLTSGGK